MHTILTQIWIYCLVYTFGEVKQKLRSVLPGINNMGLNEITMFISNKARESIKLREEITDLKARLGHKTQEIAELRAINVKLDAQIDKTYRVRVEEPTWVAYDHIVSAKSREEAIDKAEAGDVLNYDGAGEIGDSVQDNSVMRRATHVTLCDEDC